MIEILKTHLRNLISKEATRTGISPEQICIIYKGGLFYYCYNGNTANLELLEFKP